MYEGNSKGMFFSNKKGRIFLFCDDVFREGSPPARMPSILGGESGIVNHLPPFSSFKKGVLFFG